MSSNYKVVQLLRNQIYPTYQLHAYMANKKTAPQDGLRLAALVTMQWLRLRLGDHVPDEFLRLPEPSSYLEVDDNCLFSIHVNAGYVIDIVSLPEQGLWSMQITEPDLGSDPGKSDQVRQPVPGRIIETNVAYKIVSQGLECGFQTVISDPEGTESTAEVYRLAIIRQLIQHPDFGLKQILPFVQEEERLATVEQIKTCQELLNNNDAHLPLIVFTQVLRTKEEPQMPQLADLGKMPFPSFKPALAIPEQLKKPASPTISDPPYDVHRFAKSGVTLCRVYVLEERMRERFNSEFNCKSGSGDIVVLEPRSFGAKVTVIPFKTSNLRQEETVTSLRSFVFQYPRNKQVPFGQLAFLSAARESLLRLTQESIAEAETLSDQWAQKVQLLESSWKTVLADKDSVNQALQEQISRQKAYQDRIEQEKDALRQANDVEVKHLEDVISAKEEEISFLRRKLGQPKNHDEIALWIEANFSDRLVMHQKAIDLLGEKSARSVSVELICDALDFLATDYWDRRYARISSDEMYTRCSQKYGRPFEVKPTGKTAIEFTPNEYKIKYFSDAQGETIDSDLDYHLGVGNDPENLLRIYFLHDDDRKRIVIGSLPHHLRAVTIK